jgi:hypothetical protein
MEMGVLLALSNSCNSNSSRSSDPVEIGSSFTDPEGLLLAET